MLNLKFKHNNIIIIHTFMVLHIVNINVHVYYMCIRTHACTCIQTHKQRYNTISLEASITKADSEELFSLSDNSAYGHTCTYV